MCRTWLGIVLLSSHTFILRSEIEEGPPPVPGAVQADPSNTAPWMLQNKHLEDPNYKQVWDCPHLGTVCAEYNCEPQEIDPKLLPTESVFSDPIDEVVKDHWNIVNQPKDAKLLCVSWDPVPPFKYGIIDNGAKQLRLVTINADGIIEIQPPATDTSNLCTKSEKVCNHNARRCHEERYKDRHLAYPSHTVTDLEEGIQPFEGEVDDKECNEIVCLEPGFSGTTDDGKRGYDGTRSYKHQNHPFQAIVKCGEEFKATTVWYHPLDDAPSGRRLSDEGGGEDEGEGGGEGKGEAAADTSKVSGQTYGGVLSLSSFPRPYREEDVNERRESQSFESFMKEQIGDPGPEGNKQSPKQIRWSNVLNEFEKLKGLKSIHHWQDMRDLLTKALSKENFEYYEREGFDEWPMCRDDSYWKTHCETFRLCKWDYPANTEEFAGKRCQEMQISPWDIAADAIGLQRFKWPGTRPKEPAGNPSEKTAVGEGPSPTGQGTTAADLAKTQAEEEQKLAEEENGEEEEGPPSSQSTLMPSVLITMGILATTLATSLNFFIRW